MVEGPNGFSGLRVAAFESRRATEMAGLIERFGGIPSVSPSMREVPIAENREAIDFAHRVMTGQIDVIIFMTGVGIRHLLAEVERHVDRQRLLEAISDTTTIARGPKPVAVLKELGLQPTYRVGPPNTWREVLATIDEKVHVAQQERRAAGIRAAERQPGGGARSPRRQGRMPVKVYNWDLPLDLGPLEANIRAIAAGEIDVAMFTSAHQVVNLSTRGRSAAARPQLRSGMSRSLVASIGPTTSETLREFGLQVDVEPEHSKMGQLVAAAAEQSGRVGVRRSASGSSTRPATVVASRSRGERSPGRGTTGRSCGPAAGSRSTRTPIWLMRQAGRYMGEYRAVREKVSFLELCKNPALCAEVMITAVDRLGVDAAIIFSDLLPILEPMGLDLEFAPGEGPVIHNPLREAADVERLRELESTEPLAFVIETVRLTRAGLPRTDSRDRLCRRTVHAGQLRDRRGRQPQLPAHQVADVSRRRRLGRD